MNIYSPTISGSLTISGSIITTGGGLPLTGSLVSSGSFTSIGPTVVSGSFTVVTGSAIEFQVLDAGVKIGNLVTDSHSITGSLLVTGNIGVGTTPNYLIEAYQTSSTIPAARFANNQGDTVYVQGIGSYGGTIGFQQNTGSNYGTNIGYIGSIRAFEASPTADNGIGLYSRSRMSFYQNSTTPVMNITGSNVGIGTTSPTGLLDVASRGITKGSMPAGTVLQVLQTFKSDLFSIASGTPTDITGFSVTITPTSSTSKILIFTTLNSVSNSNPYPKLILYRGSTAICLGTAGSSTTKQSMMASYIAASDGTPISYSSTQIFLDSPATTSSITYKWQVYTFDAPNRTWYMNRMVGENDSNYQSAPSTITVMEIAQ
jgi:hypothetical protein